MIKEYGMDPCDTTRRIFNTGNAFLMDRIDILIAKLEAGREPAVALLNDLKKSVSNAQRKRNRELVCAW